MLRDKLLARLAEMGDAPDHQRLAADVLGIRGAPPELARRLVAQALVLEDRREIWRQAGERICRDAPATPGVYVLKDADGRSLKPEMSRAADAEWQCVGSEIEALLREAALIHTLQPPANVQTAVPAPRTRNVPRALLRDVLAVQPSIEADSVELVNAAVDGRWLLQRTRRNGADLGVHARRVMKFFRRTKDQEPRTKDQHSLLAPLVFSWLAGRGAAATRLDPHDSASAPQLQARLAALFDDERLFVERLDQR